MYLTSASQLALNFVSKAHFAHRGLRFILEIQSKWNYIHAYHILSGACKIFEAHNLAPNAIMLPYWL